MVAGILFFVPGGRPGPPRFRLARLFGWLPGMSGWFDFSALGVLRYLLDILTETTNKALMRNELTVEKCLRLSRFSGGPIDFRYERDWGLVRQSLGEAGNRAIPTNCLRLSILVFLRINPQWGL